MHRAAQLMVAAQAPGLAVQPRKIPVYYDCGNDTFDQANRLMKFERDSSLGPDTGAGWTAPIAGTLTAYLEAVDNAGNLLKDAEVHDGLQLDDWLFPEAPGPYKITAKRVNAPSGTAVATVELDLIAYYATAYTDVSDPPGDSYARFPATRWCCRASPRWSIRHGCSLVPSPARSATARRRPSEPWPARGFRHPPRPPLPPA